MKLAINLIATIHLMEVLVLALEMEVPQTL
jgi:hypothetical protein